MRRLRVWLVTMLPGGLGSLSAPNTEGPPFSGLYAAKGERVQTARAPDSETSSPGRGCYSPEPKVVAVERREADVPRHGT
jgi:hypothetical protein